MRQNLLLKIMACVVHTVQYLCIKASSINPIRPFSTSTRRSQIRAKKTLDFNSTNLTEQQKNLLKAVADRRSIFVTGSAGTGKSFILLRAIEILKRIHNPNLVFVTASTGVAACALNGQTIHSFAGVGLGKGDRELLLRRVVKNKPALNRWRKAKALVIDEVSMISSDFFDNLEYIARTIRCGECEKETAWGGIQLIVSGDFLQLHPIIDRTNIAGKEFAFEAECWDSSFDLHLELTQVFRQFDTQLIDLLQGIRKGCRDGEGIEILRQCCKEPAEPSVVVPRLYPRNQDVSTVNEMKLRSLGGEIFKYKAEDTGLQPWKNQLKLGIAQDELEICLGARVMLIKNKDLESGLVNGSTGTVAAFVRGRKVWGICEKGLLPKVRFDSGLEMVIEPEKWEVMEGEKVHATRKQIPLMLAWALSIHKCQGMTLDYLHTDLSRAFGCGMVYVALSRIRSLDGLYLSGFNSSKIKAHPKVLQFYQNQFGS